jgi:hypothetical protein
MNATIDTIEALEQLPVKIDYVGETTRDNNWRCDQWRVTFSSNAGFWATDYFTGLGHRTKPKQPWDNPRPKKPKVADVLHSLILDASASDENFNDWCDNFGMSLDSIKALNMYKDCLDTARALRKHFTPDTLRQVRELLQDY